MADSLSILNSDMADKKLIINKLLILVVAMFVLDRAAGAVLKHFFFIKKNGFDARANYVMNRSTSDVLIFGSSRASQHYNSNLLADSLQLSVFNAGRDLSYIYYHHALLEGVLQRYRPKLIVLDTRPNEFKTMPGGENLDRLNVLLPYYDSHPEIRETCLLRSKFERYKLLSKMYPYNSLILSEVVELLPIERFKKDDSQNGYIAKSGEWKGAKENYTVDDAVDPVAAAYFKKFVDACKKRDIKIVIAYSPLYQTIDSKKNRNIAFVTKVARENNIPLINYLEDPEFNNPKYFVDGLHLNRAGSNLYSNKIVSKVREVLVSR